MSQTANPSTPKYWFIVDFDGTAAAKDVQVAILDRFGPVDWREIEKRILAKGGKSYEYSQAIYANWHTPQRVVEQFVKDEMDLDPYFPDFVRWCKQKRYPVEIVSDGLDLYIDILLKRYNLNIPYRSNHIKMTKHGAMLEFPYRSSFCGKCGNCKLSRVMMIKKAHPCVKLIYIGDGISDECPSQHADMVFAKGSLARFCKEQGIEYIHFATFAHILTTLSKLLDQVETG